jgi:hypothetical protein
MGRPVRRDVRGTDVFGTYVSAAGIRCEAYFASNQTDVYIIKQKGAHRYLVADVSTVNDEDIAVGNTYVIVDTGTTDWAALGVDNAFNGKIFLATVAGTGLTTTGTLRRVQVAKLVSGTPAALGEMRLTGYSAGGADASATRIAHLNKRTAIDFSGARYTWFLDNDSSGDQIILTAI